MNFMQVVGVGDSFTPPISMAAYAGSADTDLLRPPSGQTPEWADDMEDHLITYAEYASSGCPGGLSSCVLPNRPTGAANPTHTRVSIQHPPCNTDADCPGAITSATPFDGHFVVYQNVDALQEVLGFLYTWAKNDEAEVVPQGSNL